MEFADESDCQDVRTSGAEKYGSSDFSLLDFSLFFHQGHSVVMNCV